MKTCCLNIIQLHLGLKLTNAFFLKDISRLFQNIPEHPLYFCYGPSHLLWYSLLEYHHIKRKPCLLSDGMCPKHKKFFLFFSVNIVASHCDWSGKACPSCNIIAGPSSHQLSDLQPTLFLNNNHKNNRTELGNINLFFQVNFQHTKFMFKVRFAVMQSVVWSLLLCCLSSLNRGKEV